MTKEIYTHRYYSVMLQLSLGQSMQEIWTEVWKLVTLSIIKKAKLLDNNYQNKYKLNATTVVRLDYH